MNIITFLLNKLKFKARFLILRAIKRRFEPLFVDHFIIILIALIAPLFMLTKPIQAKNVVAEQKIDISYSYPILYRETNRVVRSPSYHTDLIIIPKEQISFIWPVIGRISQYYSIFHKALDIVVPEYTPVQASEDGYVKYAAWKDGGYGYYIIIVHQDGYETWYEHNDVLLVNKGDQVIKGQVIALSGSTGHSTGPHVHFEILLRNIEKNPLWYLPFIP